MTLSSGATNVAPPTNSAAIKRVLIERRPGSAEAIKALVISNNAGIVTLRGQVEDDATHTALVDQVRSMPNVKGVRDELKVQKKPN